MLAVAAFTANGVGLLRPEPPQHYRTPEEAIAFFRDVAESYNHPHSGRTHVAKRDVVEVSRALHHHSGNKTVVLAACDLFNTVCLPLHARDTANVARSHNMRLLVQNGATATLLRAAARFAETGEVSVACNALECLVEPVVRQSDVFAMDVEVVVAELGVLAKQARTHAVLLCPMAKILGAFLSCPLLKFATRLAREDILELLVYMLEAEDGKVAERECLYGLVWCCIAKLLERNVSKAGFGGMVRDKFSPAVLSRTIVFVSMLIKACRGVPDENTMESKVVKALQSALPVFEGKLQSSDDIVAVAAIEDDCEKQGMEAFAAAVRNLVILPRYQAWRGDGLPWAHDVWFLFVANRKHRRVK